ncbi:MAG TPA: BON domain-containing protein [Terriglobales bacterium]|nr:BON domain-containing protein [Terriglobales bacterium]
MKAKTSLLAAFAAALIVAALAVGCSRVRTDAAIAQDVQQKLLLDQGISTKQIQVASDHGVITLSGTVPTENERDLAGSDAAKIDGVKTVVNNLTTDATQAAQAAPAEQAPTQPEAAPEPARSASASRSSRRPSAYHERASAGEPRSSVSSVPSGGFGAPNSDTAQNSAPAPAMAPPPPPVAASVTVPDGTELQVRLDEALSSNQNHSGDVFHGSLDQPVVLNDQTVIPAHADVTGKVVEAVAANRLTGQPSLSIEVTRLSYNDHTYNVTTDAYRRTGTSRGKRNVKTGAGGAALGAIIGAIAGGGKGAAIGAATGAGAGTAAGAATGSDDVKVDSESVISFRLQAPVTVTAAKNAVRRASDNSEPPPPQDYSQNDSPDSSSSSSSDRPVLHRQKPQGDQIPPDQQ